MIHGRRFFNQSPTRLAQFELEAQRIELSNLSMASLYRQFQHRYAWHFVLAIMGPFALFALPCVYFIFQNYDIFLRLAYDVQPQLLEHLEREKNIVFGLFVFTAISSSAFCYWLTVKLMGFIATPIWALERHMKQVSAGNWKSRDFQIRASDEFQSLTSTYSYLYRTLRVNTEKELEALESLGLDPRDRQNYTTLKNLIDVKRAQLGLESEQISAAPAAEISSSPWIRRAS
jgi:hypothetical protein